MPKYKLPALKKSKDSLEVDRYDELTEFSWARKINLPVNKEIVDSLKIGDKAEVTLDCVVKGLESRENENKTSRYNLEVELVAVEVYKEGNEFSELVEDD